MSSPNRIAIAIQSLRSTNDHGLQVQKLAPHLQPLLNHAIPRMDQSESVTFIASDLWFGNEHNDLASAVRQQCFHSDTQSRRIIGVVQAYGCGKTKTSLRLADHFILLPIRFNVDSVGSTTLVDHVVQEQKRLRSALSESPTYQELEAFSNQCLRLVHLCLFSLVALYDHCIATNCINGSGVDRFYLALLLLNDRREVVQWCQEFFDEHKAVVQSEEEFSLFARNLLDPAVPRPMKIVFLFDEVHDLFDRCRGFCLHKTTSPAADIVADWHREQTSGRPSTGHQACTDLFYQFRVVMLNYLLQPGAPFGFVMCSTMFSIWKALEEENSPLSRGTIDQFFRLHWFTHREIKEAVRRMFNVEEEWLDALEATTDGSVQLPYKRLSAYGRPLFLMEFLEQLCVTFTSENLRDASPETLKRWLRDALATSEQKAMKRAQDKIDALIDNAAVDAWTTRQIVHLLYTTQRLCGGTLELVKAKDKQTLESIISRGVARLDQNSYRFRVSDAIFSAALLQRYDHPEERNKAVLKILEQNVNLSRALISHDSSQKGYLVERLLAWLALSDQLQVPALDLQDGSANATICCSADCAGTLPELQRGETSAAEPAVLAAIMRRSERAILLPTTLAGPDLWMRASIDGQDCVVAVQSKVKNVIYSYAMFTEALASLDPGRMYHSQSAVTARTNWQPFLSELETMSYHRIIFSALGFSNEVQFAVREYNHARGRGVAEGQPRRYIHLLQLDDIRSCAGPLYDAIKIQLIKPNQAADPDGAAEGALPALALSQPDQTGPAEPTCSFLLAHEWRQLSEGRRRAMLLDTVKGHCAYRHDLSFSKKRKAALLNDLKEHSLESSVAARLALLDPHFV